jgi:dienelactone hydrolase
MLALALLFAALPWGPHAVGVFVERAPDAEVSRQVEGKPRPIQMTLWYPARRGGKRWTFADYVKLAAGVREEAKPQAERAVLDEHAAFLRNAAHMSDSDVERWLARPMRASPQAVPLGKVRGLVLVAQGNGHSAADQAILCEVLASHGWAVATSPSPTRIAGPIRSNEEAVRMGEDQALDLSAIAEAARKKPFIGGVPVLLVSHSFGARAALLYGMHHEVKAVVSLDGGIGTGLGAGHVRASPLFDAKRATAPILLFYEKLDPYMTPDFTMLRSLTKAERFFVHAPHLRHVHFSSVNEGVDEFPALAKATSADAMTARTYEEVVQLTLAFLDASMAGAPRKALAKIGRDLELTESIRQE